MSTQHVISIHAPRMGSDRFITPPASLECMISIHAPRMGSDHVVGGGVTHCLFQSTLPGWGATTSPLSMR